MADSTRLYLDDPLQCSFEATVLRRGEHRGRPSVVLDRTAFYAEAGGQMADHGTLDGQPVADVQSDDAGSIHHVLDGPLPAVGAEVHGAIDRQRRRSHMALHTGQHILSQALVQIADAPTLSSRLGETICTIDVRRPSLSAAELARIAELANDVIDDDLPIVTRYPDAEELARLPLRRRPKVSDNVRVVEIGDYDVTPCGGTHCTRSGQVGLVHIAGVERYKGGLRLSFLAGSRARAHLAQESTHLGELATRFSCGPLDVAIAVDKLQRKLSAATGALARTRTELAGHLAAVLAPRADDEGWVVAELSDAPVELLRAVAGVLTRDPKAVAVLAGPSAEGVAVVITRGAESDLHCGQLLGQAAQACGGRGGGRPDHAEGRLPAGSRWTALIEAVRAGR